MVNRIDVILYYHVEPGIFGRAPTSVFAQKFHENHILVVDHQSPRPTAGELAELSRNEKIRITNGPTRIADLSLFAIPDIEASIGAKALAVSRSSLRHQWQRNRRPRYQACAWRT